MKLSEVAFSEIKIGQRVKSDKAGVEGTVFQKNDTPSGDWAAFVGIDWDNGNRSSHVPHEWCDKVTVL